VKDGNEVDGRNETLRFYRRRL